MIKIILYILAFLLAIVVSWGITAGAIKLICLCFSLQFSWKIATGVWLILTLISGFLKNTIHISISIITQIFKISIIFREC